MRHVALLIETAGSYGRGLLAGVARYNREHGGWSTYFRPRPVSEPLPAWLAKWKGDGILARIDSKEVAEFVLQLGIPAVNLRLNVPSLPIPYVGLDHAEVGQLAAVHLMDRGFKSFGFCGRPRGVHPGLDERGDRFKEVVTAAGFPFSQFQARKQEGVLGWEKEQQQIVNWLETLPRPVGILASNDERGLEVLDACRRRGFAVPDEIAVVGVDNDEPLCELAIPPLTSIDPNPLQIGYAAAEFLDQLMGGKKRLPLIKLISPRGIIVRRSSDTLASEDTDVNDALHFIRDRFAKNIGVTDVLTHVGVSRGVLQQKMKQVIGRTIHQEIERVRLNRAKELLAMGNLSIKQVAREVGFSSPQYLTRVFRAVVGETPAKFRNSRLG
jgi:LacI family transcriptional regulator